MTGRNTGSAGRQGLPPRQWLVTYALGLAGGLGVNTLSTDVGYRGAATAAAIAAILISTNWLRQLPPRAPVTRIASRALLGGAALAAVVAAIKPGWEGPATITATVLTTSAVLIPAELERAVELLIGIALIGVGVANIGIAIAVLRNSHVLTGIANIGAGIAWISIGVAVLREGRVLAWVTNIGGGATVARGTRVLRGVAIIGPGIACIGVGVTTLRDSYILTGIAAPGNGYVLAGVAFIGAGIAVIGYGVVILNRAGIVSHALKWLVSITKDPSIKAPHNDKPTVSSLDDPPAETRSRADSGGGHGASARYPDGFP